MKLFTKEELDGLLRQLFTFLGIFIMAKGWLPGEIWDYVVGIAIAGGATFYGVIDKDGRGIWMAVLSFIRHTLNSVGAILIFYDVSDQGTIESIIGIVLSVVSFVWSIVDKKMKSKVIS